MTFFRSILAVFAVCVIAQEPAMADGQHHEAAASSSASLDIAADGTVAMHARNTQLIPYVVYDRDRHLPRLATVTTDVKRRTDAEGDDPSSTVSVAVDDLSAAAPKRLASFSDPGSEGVMLGENYFDSRMPGCCAGPTVHSVRILEDGKLLYRATGDDGAGSAAFAIAPNAGPRMVRFAAFDGRVDQTSYKAGVVGYISYGGLDGTLSRLEVKAPAGADDINLGLSHGAKLVWVDTKSQESGHPPASGSPDSPENIWSLDKIQSADKIGGFSLQLADFDGHVLATIPIAGDRLVPDQAKLDKGISLSDAAK